MKRLLPALAIFTLSALAADITGTWKGTAETPNGTITRTFQFKVDGTKLTGETSSEMMGTSEIMDGKVDGDNLSFTIKGKIQDNEIVLHYKGKVNGDEMKLTVQVGDSDQTAEYTVKRVS